MFWWWLDVLKGWVKYLMIKICGMKFGYFGGTTALGFDKHDKSPQGSDLSARSATSPQPMKGTDTNIDGASDLSARRVSNPTVSADGRRPGRRRYIRRISADAERLDEKRKTAGDIANDLAVLEARMEARARRRQNKGTSRRSDLNRSLESPDGRGSDTSSAVSEDSRSGRYSRTKTTPVTNEEYNKAMDISLEGRENLTLSETPKSTTMTANQTRREKINAILNRCSSKLPSEPPSPGKNEERSSPPKDNLVHKQIKLYTAGQQVVSDKVKKLSSPDAEPSNKGSGTGLFWSLRDTRPTHDKSSPIRVTADEKMSTEALSHISPVGTSYDYENLPFKSRISPPPTRLFSKEEPVQTMPERDISKPVRRTSSLRDNNRRPNKLSSSDQSDGPDAELSRILLSRRGEIDNQLNGKRSPKLEDLENRWSPRHVQNAVNKDDNIQDEGLKNVLKFRRARSESLEKEVEKEADKPKESIHSILKADSKDLEKEPVPILRKKSPDEKEALVKIQEPLPILRRKSLEPVDGDIPEPVPILRVKSLDSELADVDEPVSILKNKEELGSEPTEPLHSILKHKYEDSQPPSILKHREGYDAEEVTKDDHKPASILKKRDSSEQSSSTTSSPMRSRRNSGEDIKPTSILRKRDSEDSTERRLSEPELRFTSILKKRDSADSDKPESTGSSRRGSCEDVRPVSILKKRDSFEAEDLESPTRQPPDQEEVKPILKKRDRSRSPADKPSALSPCRSTEDLNGKPLPGILKRSTFDDHVSKSDEPIPSIMKRKENTEMGGSSERPSSVFRKREGDSSKSPINLPEFLSQISDMSANKHSASTSPSVVRERSSSLTEALSRQSDTKDFNKTAMLISPKLVSVGDRKCVETSSMFTMHVADFSPAAKKSSPGRPVQKKAHTIQIMDSQLAEALKARREQDGSSDDEKVEAKPLSASEEIKRLREAAEDAFEVDAPPVSVQARIFQMETKLEDEACTPLRSRTGSGRITPKYRQDSLRTGQLSPKIDRRIGGAIPEDKQISNEQLMAKLTDVAKEPLIARRRTPQQSRARDWRSQTTPVTEEELAEANSLVSVAEFRRIIEDKSASDISILLQKDQPRLPSGVKKSEYPQHLSLKKKLHSRRTSSRFKTQPITCRELTAIPETGTPDLLSKVDAPVAKGAESKIQAHMDIRPTGGSTDVERQSSRVTEPSVSQSQQPTVSAIPGVQVVNSDGALKDHTHSDLDSITADNVLSDKDIENIEKEFEKLFDLTDEEDKEPSLTGTEDKEFDAIVSLAEEHIKQPLLSIGKPSKFRREKSPRRDKEKTRDGLESQTKNIDLSHAAEPPVAANSSCQKSDSLESEIVYENFAAQQQSDMASNQIPREVIAWDRTAELENVLKPQPTVIDLAEVKEHHIDEKTKLSVVEKAALFAKSNETPVKKIGAKRFVSKEKRERSSTQPVTPDEVKQAAAISGSNNNKQVDSRKDEHVRLRLNQDVDDLGKAKEVMQEIEEQREKDQQDEDALSKLSLAEKMRLFTERNEEKPPPKRDAPVTRRKQRRTQSRFATQPITTEEVEKAAKVSPLACSLIKPPDPEILGCMPLNAQRDIVALHAEAVLGQSQGYRSKSAASSDGQKGATSTEKKEVPSIEEPSKNNQDTNEQKNLKPLSVDSTKVRSILKREGSFERSRAGLAVRKQKPEEEGSNLDEELTRTQPVASTPLVVQKPDLGSSSEETTPIKCSNEAIARRRVRKEQERYHTQPIGSSPETDQETKRQAKLVTTRHLTQPITSVEKKLVEEEYNEEEMENKSISERLALLKKRGEEDWKKRVSKTDDDLTTSDVKLRERQSHIRPERPRSITDLKSQLAYSRDDWKGRVEDKDMKRFTVEGKISASGRKPTPDSPLLSRKKKTARAEPVRLRDDSEATTASPPLSPKKVSLPETERNKSTSPSTDTSTADEEKEPAKKVALPTFDDAESFFLSKTTEEINKQNWDVDAEAFTDVFLMSQDRLESRVRIKPKRTRKGQQNPLRALKERKDLRKEYEEKSSSNVAEKEIRRIQVEKLGPKGLAESALAGLASKENFSKVALKKVTETSTPSRMPEGMRLEPYKDVMLLQIKGRRQIQVRLVEPTASSLNSGDCFILVTPDRLFCWTGEFSNVIEKAKAQEIATTIFQKKDLGYKGNREAVMIDERKHLDSEAFWKILGGKEEYQDVGPDDEDLLYETYLLETNMVYRVEDNSLIPVEEYWGCVLKYEMLNTEEIYICDFGTELYIWQGKKVSFEKRKVAIKLAKQLWDQGYDYSELEISPLSPFLREEDGGYPLKGAVRPDWCLLAKVNEDMETVAFREKFKDWPESSRIIRMKGTEADQNKTEPVLDLKPYDAKLLILPKQDPVTIVLEGSNIGRGKKWIESFEGLKKEFDIVTNKVTVWHVMEYDHYKIPPDSYGQFHDSDTYVVRWQYMIMAGGLKSLKGKEARQSLTGRERCAYLFWQGKNSTVNEQGASALMTVELDEERGPHVRVTQGREPPCFLNFFNGDMIIHIGKREEELTNTQGAWRLYAVRNEIESESYLMEVLCSIKNLRSRSSFILLNVQTGTLYLWHGAKSLPHTRTVAQSLARRLSKKCPLEIGLKENVKIVVTELEEGREKKEFWRGIGDSTRTKYDTLSKERRDYNFTPRMFHAESISGTFVVTEQLNPARNDLNTPYPFLQDDLYKVSQPALFIFDNDFEVFLWQGWWPEGDEETDNVNTGSARARFNLDRKCAMETALHYCRERNAAHPPKSYLVYAGLEPQHFINLFPTWEVDEEARQANIKDGRKEGMFDLQEVLVMISRTEYSLAELQERPLPDGVDPSKIESYLADKEFEDLMGMTKTDYYALPPWKQIELKKAADLF